MLPSSRFAAAAAKNDGRFLQGLFHHALHAQSLASELLLLRTTRLESRGPRRASQVLAAGTLDNLIDTASAPSEDPLRVYTRNTCDRDETLQTFDSKISLLGTGTALLRYKDVAIAKVDTLIPYFPLPQRISGSTFNSRSPPRAPRKSKQTCLLKIRPR